MDVENIRLVAFAVLVALLLVSLPFYPGTFSPGHDPNSYNYKHQIEEGPTENVTGEADNVTGNLDFGGETDVEDITYEYEKLSPIAQVLFERTLNAKSLTHTPVVCEDYVLVCDGYYKHELPSEFTYGAGEEDELHYSIIESNGSQYLLRTGVLSPGAWQNLHIAILVTFFRALMLLLGGVIITATVIRLSDRWTGANGSRYSALVGAGAVFAVLGFLTPYLEIYGGIDFTSVLLASGATGVIGYIFVWYILRTRH
jgi:hypothetical protein